MAQQKDDDKLKQGVIDAVLIDDHSAAPVARNYELPTSAVYARIHSPFS